eukprot:SAG11_NODE_2692_length_3090_cov_2.761618_5_plen_73_part_00
MGDLLFNKQQTPDSEEAGKIDLTESDLAFYYKITDDVYVECVVHATIGRVTDKKDATEISAACAKLGSNGWR